MSDDQALVAALWIVLTWLHEWCTHSPILLATSPLPNSGKTTLLKVIGYMSRRSVSTVSITGPALFRSIEKWAPTFIIDEADTALVNNDDLKEVINSGWTRGDRVIRCDERTKEPHAYSTFCPKAIGMIGRNLPPATLSRCLIVAMTRKKAGEVTDDFDFCDNETFTVLRSQILRFATDNAEALATAKPETPPSFDNRVRMNWKLLLAIADLAGGPWPKAARDAAVAVEQVSAAADPGTSVQLLSDSRDAFDRFGDEMWTETLITELVKDKEGPWLHYGKSREPITDRQLARLLKDFRGGLGIRSKNVRVGDVVRKGYKRSDFEDDFARYLPPKALSSATPLQASDVKGLDENLSATSTADVADKNAPNPLEDNGCSAVAPERAVAAETGAVAAGRCAQCNGEPDGEERLRMIDGVPTWLHPGRCERFYVADKDEAPR